MEVQEEITFSNGQQFVIDKTNNSWIFNGINDADAILIAEKLVYRCPDVISLKCLQLFC
jgi:hypothetical protein